MTFYVKCSMCRELYDGHHQLCPYDQCGRIVPRIYWTREDYAKEKALKEKDKGVRL